MSELTVLVIDDESQIRRVVRHALEAENARVVDDEHSELGHS